MEDQDHAENENYHEGYDERGELRKRQWKIKIILRMRIMMRFKVKGVG